MSRQLLFHRLKTNIVGSTGHVMQRGSYVKKPLYEPVPATFAGTSALRRTIGANSSTDFTTVSIWVYVPTGTVSQKIYDIGDAGGAASETTRLMIDAGGLLDTLIANFNDGSAWDVMAQVSNIPFVADSWNHLYMTARNGANGGPNLDVWLNGSLAAAGSANPGITWSPDSTIDFLVNDDVVIGARHNLTQHFVGGMADIWTSSRYMDAATNVPLFFSPAVIPGWTNGTPRPVGTVVNGITAGNFLGGQGYTIDDWNNGLNKGANGDFTLDGDPLT